MKDDVALQLRSLQRRVETLEALVFGGREPLSVDALAAVYWEASRCVANNRVEAAAAPGWARFALAVDEALLI